FNEHAAYLPGDTWPETWLLQVNQMFVRNLAEALSIDENSLVEILEYGLQAGKHNEFYELSMQLGLSESQCIQALVMNIQKNDPNVFNELITRIESALE